MVQLVQRPLALAASCALLAACQTGSPAGNQAVDPYADTYIGWYCTGDKKADTWTCTQRRLRDGEPVDNVVLGVKQSAQKAGTGKPAVTAAAATEQGSTVADGRREWLNSLPALNEKPASDPVGTAGPDAATAGSGRDESQTRPVPVTAFEEGSDGKDSNAPGTAGGNTSAPAFTARVEPGSDEMVEGGFTIQLGAFSTREKREIFVTRKGLDTLKLRRFRITSQGQEWWILTYGDFRTRDEAIIAWAAESKAFQPLEVWVRSTDSIKNALPNASQVKP